MAKEKKSQQSAGGGLQKIITEGTRCRIPSLFAIVPHLRLIYTSQSLLTCSISPGRERKKVQDTADKIFGKRGAAGKKGNGTNNLLTNRAGVSKVRSHTSWSLTAKFTENDVCNL